MSKKKSPEQLALEKSIVTLLHNCGPMSKGQLVLATGVKPGALGFMRRAGHICFVDDDNCEATNHGRQTFGIQKDRTGLTPGVLHIATGTYDGAEMKPFSSRAGANDAFVLPSRGYQC